MKNFRSRQSIDHGYQRKLTSASASQSPMQFSKGKMRNWPLFPTLRRTGRGSSVGEGATVGAGIDVGIPPLTFGSSAAPPRGNNVGDVAAFTVLKTVGGRVVVAAVAARPVGTRVLSFGAVLGANAALIAGVNVGLHVGLKAAGRGKTQKSARVPRPSVPSQPGGAGVSSFR
jgi:hypothetical protein